MTRRDDHGGKVVCLQHRMCGFVWLQSRDCLATYRNDAWIVTFGQPDWPWRLYYLLLLLCWAWKTLVDWWWFNEEGIWSCENLAPKLIIKNAGCIVKNLDYSLVNAPTLVGHFGSDRPRSRGHLFGWSCWLINVCTATSGWLLFLGWGCSQQLPSGKRLQFAMENHRLLAG